MCGFSHRCCILPASLPEGIPLFDLKVSTTAAALLDGTGFVDPARNFKSIQRYVRSIPTSVFKSACITAVSGCDNASDQAGRELVCRSQMEGVSFSEAGLEVVSKWSERFNPRDDGHRKDSGGLAGSGD